MVTYPSRATSFNRYAYAMDNPLRFIDPTGWDAKEARDYAADRDKSMSPSDPGADKSDLSKTSDSSNTTKPKNQKNIAEKALDRYVDSIMTPPGIHPDKMDWSNAEHRNLAGLAMMQSLVGAKIVGAPRLGANTARANAGATAPANAPAQDKAGNEIGRIVVDSKGNAMIEPKGGKTVAAGKAGEDTHTLYPNGSNYQRLNPNGHSNNPTPHGHGHAPGTGPGMKGQGPSLDVNGNIVPSNSPAAHWPLR